MFIILQQHRHLVGSRRQNILFVQVVRAQLILRVVPQPSELMPRMFRSVELLEAVIGYCDLGGNDEVMRWQIKGPKVGTKNHNAERDIRLVQMVFFHAQMERIGKIFAKTHV